MSISSSSTPPNFWELVTSTGFDGYIGIQSMNEMDVCMYVMYRGRTPIFPVGDSVLCLWEPHLKNKRSLLVIILIKVSFFLCRDRDREIHACNWLVL